MGAGLFGSGPDLAPQPSFRPFPLLFRGCTSSWLQLPHRWRRRCEWQGWETKDSFYWRLLPSQQGATRGSAAAGWVGVPWMSASAARLSSGDFNGPSLPVCSLCHLRR